MIEQITEYVQLFWFLLGSFAFVLFLAFVVFGGYND